MFKKIKGFFRKKSWVDEIPVVNLDIQKIFDSPYRGLDDDMTATIAGAVEKNRQKKKRIPVKPIDIIHDLEESVDFPKTQIKEAIKNLEIRIKFMKETLKETNSYTNEEGRALQMLKARLEYPKVAHLFIWKTTTRRHIEKMLDKYDLQHQEVRSYVKSLPCLAITAMQAYANVFAKVSKDAPAFSLIAPPKYFKSEKIKDKKRDPILLARSPFGHYFYILTAWDKEISMVTELLDGEELVIDKNGNGKIEKKK